MSQVYDSTKPESGVTTFGELYARIRNHFAAVVSSFSGTSFPASATTGQLCYRTDLGSYGRLYIYCGDTGQGTNGWIDADVWSVVVDALKDEVEDARGSASTLDARLDVAINEDGTLKTSAPAGSWWTDEADTVAYVDSTSFTVNGDKTAIYLAERAVKLDQTTDDYAFVVSSSYNGGTNKTTVVVEEGTVDSGLTLVSYGQPPTNTPKPEAASTTVRGSVELATETETRNGTADKIPDAAKLQDTMKFFWQA